MFKKLLMLSVVMFFSFSFLIGCDSEDESAEDPNDEVIIEEEIDEEEEEEEEEEEVDVLTFSDERVELIVENVIVDHPEDMEVRDRGDNGVDMMLDDQIFVNINPIGLALDEFTFENAGAMVGGMNLQNATELERITINDQDAFLIQGSMEDMPDFIMSILMFLANDYLYSMGYIAPEEAFELYYPYYVEIRESIRAIEIEVLTNEEIHEMVIERLNEMDSDVYIDFREHGQFSDDRAVVTFNQRVLASILGLDYEEIPRDAFNVSIIEHVNLEGEVVDPEDDEVNESNFVEWTFDYEIDDDDERMTITFTVVYDIEVEEEMPLEPVTIFAGDWEGGTDVPVGRWVITGVGSGNFTIWRGTSLHVNEILGGIGVTSVTTNIAEGDEINISGLNEVTFTPVLERTTSTTLTTGHWVVGEDIEAGSYDATSPSGSGNFVIWRGNDLRTNEILGDSDFGVDRVRVNLANGDRIEISSLEQVVFEESD